MRKGLPIGFVLVLLLLMLPESAPAFTVQAVDAPNDEGAALYVSWDLPDELGVVADELHLLRSGDPGASLSWEPGSPMPPPGWTTAIRLPAAAQDYRDSGLEKGRPYVYALAVLSGGEVIGVSQASGPARPKAQFFHRAKGFLLINLLVVAAAILISVFLAQRGRQFTIRKIAGLDAVEEAVGRATEMGKSVLFVPGIQDMDNVQTVAGITILGSIAQMTAKYETTLNVPVSKSLVMSTGRETVKESYAAAGRPDLYHDEVVHYVTDEQFGYVAAIDGLMLRDRPATCFYMGAFFAESLILAETGNSIGAIQIAGTAQPTQLPFFVAACDYTLIGEELFAASAYLSRNPSLLGSLRGQDIGKALAMGFILIGVAAETIGRLGDWGSPALALSEFLRRFFATNF